MCHLGSLITIWPAVHNHFCFCLRFVFLAFLIYWCRWAYCQPAVRWFSAIPRWPVRPCCHVETLIFSSGSPWSNRHRFEGVSLCSVMGEVVLWTDYFKVAPVHLFSTVDWGLEIFTGTEFNICLKLTFNTGFLNGVPTTDTIRVFF